MSMRTQEGDEVKRDVALTRPASASTEAELETRNAGGKHLPPLASQLSTI
jgi:hypothetical protein